ncbi:MULTISPECIES: hypothetical protein [Hydrogenophaga]|jgi:hypothetical protein|uniref:Uncharacterized protein n=1 Tax=Hydrogenophaga intermedia TaxID=65786 RepID=A0A1L1P9N4_HYDIT|nr:MULTISPECIES: hypothetical protein [Hydrogenophaga]AOS79414.1 hypothetical protein Q5W_10785 [Hydrogenophaga sp. PBC]TMU76962.1 hypothetical protein FGJ01_03580 [Hydrogenophaga intermedia]CDN86582.1 hypothetical protein BN948_00987 [Hydrogenophaga intermedia]
MKARYYVHCFEGFDPLDEYRLLRVGGLINSAESLRSVFNSYLFSSITSDFYENRYGDVDETLVAIEQIEHGKLDAYDTGGNGFSHHITRERVRFEHSVFGECPEWPIWCCTLAQYKAALQGYRRFLDMPKSIDSELIIDLPDGEARCD